MTGKATAAAPQMLPVRSRRSLGLAAALSCSALAACGGGGASAGPGAAANAIPAPVQSTIVPVTGATASSAASGAVAGSGTPAGAAAGSSPISRPAVTATANSQAGNSQAATDSLPVRVTLNFTIPTGTQTQSRASTAGALRKPLYISASNANMTVTVTPFGGGPSTYGPNPCTIGSCTAVFTANPGPNTISFSLTAGGGNVLSSYSTIQIIQPVVQNTLNFTPNPVVNSASLSLAAASANGGTPLDDVLTINALDKSGNTIVGPGNYVDASGNPVALSLSVTNYQNGGKGSVVLKGPSRITAPAQAAIYAHYDGNWLDHSTISLTANRTLSGAVTGTTFTTNPAAVEYSGFAGGAQPYNVALGSDGNLWVTEFNNSALAKVSLAGVVLNEYPTLSQPHYIIAGPGGKLWFTEQGVSDIGAMTTGGARTDFPGSYASYVNITNGPDGNVWFMISQTGVDNYIANITTAGTFTYYTVGGATNTRAITLGADGNLWSSDSRAANIFKTTPAGVMTQYTYVNGCAFHGGDGDGMALGHDGRVWFIECDMHTIGAVTPGGTISSYSAGMSGGAMVRDVYNGPDGNIWFSEENTSTIGRITPAGTITEFPVFSGGSTLRGAVIGPDGNLWVCEFDGDRIAKFVY